MQLDAKRVNPYSIQRLRPIKSFASKLGDAVEVKHMNIMVIDDDAGSLRGMMMALDCLGYGCHAFNDPKEALKSFSSRDYGAVISDLRMQPINGIQLMVDIHTLNPLIPVIIVSGYADSNSIQEVFEQGALAFLEKPLDAMELARVLEGIASDK